MDLVWISRRGGLDAKKIRVLFSSCLGLSMIFLHTSILPPAISMMQSQLMTTNMMTRWILNIFFLMAACSVIICGRIADAFGHKNNMMWGFILSGFSSLIACFADHAYIVLVCRGVQGIAVALLSPSITAILLENFPKQDQGKAMGFVTGLSSIFMVLGPFIGGLLTQFYSWRWTFFVFAPLSVIGMVCNRYIQEASKEGKVNLALHFKEFLLYSLPIATLVFGFMNVKGWGWTSFPFFLCVGSSLFWFGFGGKFLNLQAASMPHLELLFIPTFSLSLFILLISQFVLMNSIFWGIFFQKGLGYTPFKIGLIAFVFSLPNIIVSPYSGHISDSKGSFMPIALGHFLIVTGISLINLVVVKQYYHLMWALFCICGAGVGLLLTSTGALSMKDVPAEKRGMAAGIYNTVRFASAAIAIALLGSVSAYLRTEGMEKIIHQLHELQPFSVKEVVDILSGRFPLSFLESQISEESLCLVKQGFFSVSKEGFQFLNVLVVFLVLLSFFYSISFFKNNKYHNLLSQKKRNS